MQWMDLMAPVDAVPNDILVMTAAGLAHLTIPAAVGYQTLLRPLGLQTRISYFRIGGHGHFCGLGKRLESIRTLKCS